MGTLATVLGDEAIFQAPISWRQADRRGSAAHPAKLNQRLRGSAAHPAKPHPQTTHAEAHHPHSGARPLKPPEKPTK